MNRSSLLFLLFPFLALPVAAQMKTSALTGKIILIDPGHGTMDFRCRPTNEGKETLDGKKEYRLNLEIAGRLRKNLELAGAFVYLTRAEGAAWRRSYSPAEDNKNRALLANSLSADAFLSIHCDWHPNRHVQGIRTFYLKKNSYRLGKVLQKHLIGGLKASDRKLVKESFTVLDHSEGPAVLIETGFMSHPLESRRLMNPVYQEKIARSLAKGLKAYFR